MIDTLHLQLTGREVEGVDFFSEVTPHLNPEGVAWHTNSGGDWITANLDGLQIRVSRGALTIGKGSICKWMLGDNYKTMTRADLQRAIERLSDELHQPIERASVARLDVATNIITRHPTEVYFNHFGALSYAHRLMQESGLYYKRPNITAAFYDKNREQRTHREAIPEVYRGANVLRYELRFTHRLPKVFKCERVTAADLYNEAFYISLLNRWRDTYRAIQKLNEITLNFQAMRTKREFNKMGILSIVERFGGEVETIAHITEAQKRGELTAKQAYDLKQSVKDACKEREGITAPSEAITELDKKITEAIRFYR